MSASERQSLLQKRLESDSEQNPFTAAADFNLLDTMIENSVGVMGMPLGVATNFQVNGFDVLVPMAVEEPSVIAAASNAAKMARSGYGFRAETTSPLMVAQIEILDPHPGAASKIEAAKQEILSMADSAQKELVSLGGGAVELEIRENVGEKRRLVLHLVVNCIDAMGANSVNTMAEAVSAQLGELTGGIIGLRIVSNLADRRLVKVSSKIPFDALTRNGFSGAEVARGVEAASQFALADPYRAATHNKGIFNGVDAVLLATGNDWRAVEAGGHAFAAMKGTYSPLSTWKIFDDKLEGSLEMPMAVGIVGGAAKVHPIARLCLDLMGVESAVELAWIVASAGLACNLAALAALSSEGIQQGHMRLHRRKGK
jgi:hydroxymethylglutaryl-CoA reductase